MQTTKYIFITTVSEERGIWEGGRESYRKWDIEMERAGEQEGA